MVSIFDDEEDSLHYWLSPLGFKVYTTGVFAAGVVVGLGLSLFSHCNYGRIDSQNNNYKGGSEEITEISDNMETGLEGKMDNFENFVEGDLRLCIKMDPKYGCVE